MNRIRRFSRPMPWLTSIAILVLATSASAEVPADSPIAEQLRVAESAVHEIVSISADQRTFQNTIVAIDDLLARLEFTTSMMQFMPYVSTDAAQRAEGERATQDLQNWMVDLSKNQDLYDAVIAYTKKAETLRGEEARLLTHMIRDYRRSGMALSQEKRDELAGLEKEINKLSQDFEKNIREDATVIFVARRELGGMPDEYIDGLKRCGDLYIISMDYPTFLPLMDYCDDEFTRQRAWMAYKRRGGTKNVEMIEHIIRLRAEAAQLLGYAHPADFENEVRMSKEAATVMDFYERLRPLVREKALVDHAEFLAAKREHTGDRSAKLQAWDFSFYKNRLMRDKYAVDAEKVREYFPLEAVIDGLFSITQSLYGLEYVEITDKAASMGKPLWHEDARLFEVWDTATRSQLGEFYVDLHPRDNKYGHAAQWGLKQHKRWSDGSYEKPLAALVCNFSKPTGDKPSLLTHDEVETFFHEFGHCLHTILSEADYYEFAGTSVERDFVEAPSQMFENWVWDAEVLGTFARHYETGAAFPAELLEGMMKARNLGSGMAAERQFFYGLFDMNCHLDAEGDVDTTQLAHDLWDPSKMNVELYDEVPGTFFHASFGHLTGYQAGYYGYQWSLVYACDMFQRFKELGMLNPEAGAYYRKKILARGGTVDGLDMVREYLGREPDLAAFLHHLGLETDSE